MDYKIRNSIENTDLTLHQIANKLGVSINKVRKVWSTYTKQYRTSRKALCYRASKLGDKNPMSGKTGDEHHNYIGVVGDSKGYLLVMKPDWYTGRAGSKHIFQHSFVICSELDLTEVPKGFVIHHCDTDPRNNDFNN